MKHKQYVVFSAVITLLMLFILSLFVPKEECSYVCQFTGSRIRYTLWANTYKTHEWYDASEMEKRLRKIDYPIKHEWRKYQGCDTGFYGLYTVREHAHRFKIEGHEKDILDLYVKQASDKEVVELYVYFQQQKLESNEILEKFDEMNVVLFGK